MIDASVGVAAYLNSRQSLHGELAHNNSGLQNYPLHEC